MKKPLSQLKAFFKLAEERKLSGSDQLLYLHLFNKFNAAHWTETLRVSDQELITAMRLYDSNGKPASLETLRRCKQRLKSKGFIDYEPGNGSGVTKFFLPQIYPEDTPDATPDGSPEDTPERSKAAALEINAREDVQDFKDGKDRKNTTTATAGAGALAGVYDVPSKRIQEMWLRCEGEIFKGSIAFGLYDLEKLYGVDEVCAAILIASQANKAEKLTYPFVKRVLENRKGGLIHGGGNHYGQYSFEDQFTV